MSLSISSLSPYARSQVEDTIRFLKPQNPLRQSGLPPWWDHEQWGKSTNSTS